MSIVPVAIALLVNGLLGWVVYRANSRRVANLHFLTLSMILVVWLLFLGAAMVAGNASWSAFFIRQASSAGIFVPVGFNLLRLAVLYREETWMQIVLRSRSWFVWNLAVCAFCQTPFFLKDVVLAGGGMASAYSVPEPVYEVGFVLYCFYFMGITGMCFFRLVEDVRRTTGVRRNELYFILLACVGLLIGVVMAFILPLITGNSQFIRFVPLGVAVFDGMIAYGIATRRILDVEAILRRVVAYAILVFYVGSLYGAAWFLTRRLLWLLTPYSAEWAHLVAAVVIASTMFSSQAIVQRVMKHLFIGNSAPDAMEINRRAQEALHFIATLPNLLRRFSSVIVDAVGTDRISIHLLERGQFVPKYSYPGGESFSISRDEPGVNELETTKKPIVADGLERLLPLPGVRELSQWMERHKAAVAVGIFARDQMEGIMLLGVRLSGGVYGGAEQDMLQILCNQLGIALQNAQLYTEVQNGKIYNDSLLESLVSGVVAANAEGVITVCNREAGRLIGLQADQAAGRPVHILPSPVDEVFHETFMTGRGVIRKEVELSLHGGGKAIVQMSSAVFRGHAGGVLGAFIVLNDITNVKKLEGQVRQNDRLASVGTLSAGMAHEIKNPLVTVKTFTQLLPERFSDADFREKFSTLVGHEVERIDSIVNQLLRFARPARPNLTVMDLSQPLEQSMELVRPQLKRKCVSLQKDMPGTPLMVHADGRLLEQAFLNLFLNALDAMKKGGRLSVSVRIMDESLQRQWTADADPLGSSVCVTVRDAGHGIPPDQIANIFDPFFTTKSSGTGLGLAIAHQIIQEHGARIEVESELGKGTSFRIVFALTNERELKT
ncbi:MAG: ATP-binding protein [Verrucomicrobiae bacterium]|nr:ATP-binding protein [Verrucomicrobiae bacterium]